MGLNALERESSITTGSRMSAGKGPFPAVAFNHGGVGSIMGGVPKETCQALAAAGFVAFAPSLRKAEKHEIRRYAKEVSS